MKTHPCIILYAEDSEDDAFLMRRAFTKAGFPGALIVVGNGLDAMRYLGGEGRYADRSANPLPCVILLDIKMPLVTGLAALAWIRARRELDATPVLMLSSSSQESDIQAAYASGANSYVVKPGSLEVFAAFVNDLAIVCASLPHRQTLTNIHGAVPPPWNDSARGGARETVRDDVSCSG